jgi:hypothetical protein
MYSTWESLILNLSGKKFDIWLKLVALRRHHKRIRSPASWLLTFQLSWT